jgi:hypothetical protein
LIPQEQNCFLFHYFVWTCKINCRSTGIEQAKTKNR